MANLTVVIVLRFVVGIEVGQCERSMHKSRPLFYWRSAKELRDHVLMLVMWKLDQKLSAARRISKSKLHLIPRRNFGMTNRTNCRLGSFEKLPAMTTQTRVMVRIIGDVRVVSHLSPVTGRNFVAGIASFLVLFGSVREFGVIDGSRASSWWTSGSTGCSFLSNHRTVIGELLRINQKDESRQREGRQYDQVAFHSI